MLARASLWSAYTVFFLPDVVQLYIANFSGVVLGTTYLAVIAALGVDLAYRLRVVSATAAVQALAWGLYVAILTYLSRTDAQIVLSVAVHNHSLARVPVLLSALTFISGVNWVIVGIALGDYYILSPNALAVLFGGFQLVEVQVIKRYQRRHPLDVAAGGGGKAPAPLHDSESTIVGGPVQVVTDVGADAGDGAIVAGLARPVKVVPFDGIQTEAPVEVVGPAATCCPDMSDPVPEETRSNGPRTSACAAVGVIAVPVVVDNSASV